MGDFKTQLGSDNSGQNEGIGQIAENGELFSDLCPSLDLVIGDTFFPHKGLHKLT